MVVVLTLLLFTKHFIFDFVYQPPYQWQNKGTYGHWGGIVHSLQHAVPTFFILLFFIDPILALGLSCLEFTAHYHIDWAKMSINASRGWKCNTHNEFWILTGLDQYLHALTYIGIIAYVYLR